MVLPNRGGNWTGPRWRGNLKYRLSGDPGNPSAGMIRAVPGLGEIGLPIERDRVNWAGGRVPRRSRPPGFRRPRAGKGEFHPADTTTPAEKGSVLIPVIPQESDWL
jgi:hypothetical protein